MSSTSNAGLAITAIAIGGATGGAVICAVLAVAYGMPRGPQSAFADLTLGAAFASLAIAAGVGFGLARPLGVWRALLTAMIAVSGTALVAVLTTVADAAAGRAGLLVLAALCGGAILGAARLRQASRAAA